MSAQPDYYEVQRYSSYISQWTEAGEYPRQDSLEGARRCVVFWRDKFPFMKLRIVAVYCKIEVVETLDPEEEAA